MTNITKICKISYIGKSGQEGQWREISYLASGRTVELIE